MYRDRALSRGRNASSVEHGRVTSWPGSTTKMRQSRVGALRPCLRTGPLRVRRSLEHLAIVSVRILIGLSQSLMRPHRFDNDTALAAIDLFIVPDLVRAVGWKRAGSL
jgi:hypothetical protein